MKKISYNAKQVRLLAVVLFIVVFFITYKLTLSKSLPVKIVIFSIEFLVLISALAIPRKFFPIFKMIIVLAGFIGNIVYTVISTLIFYFILTPISLLMRLFGRKFLIHKIDQSLDTYYEDDAPHTGVENQF